MQNQHNPQNKVTVFKKDNRTTRPPLRHSIDKHRRLIVCVLGAMVVFIILYRVWFYVMGAFAVIGAVWVIREYNKNEK